ncbi:hypothetical protein AALA54_12385 [Oscillospiraceae bacterium 44-34]|jgi:hypothetical protein
MISFIVYFFLCAAGLFFSTLLLASLGDHWLIFGLIFGGAALAGLRMLWEKLDRVEKKLNKLLKEKEEE